MHHHTLLHSSCRLGPCQGLGSCSWCVLRGGRHNVVCVCLVVCCCRPHLAGISCVCHSQLLGASRLSPSRACVCVGKCGVDLMTWAQADARKHAQAAAARGRQHALEPARHSSPPAATCDSLAWPTATATPTAHRAAQQSAARRVPLSVASWPAPDPLQQRASPEVDASALLGVTCVEVQFAQGLSSMRVLHANHVVAGTHVPPVNPFCVCRAWRAARVSVVCAGWVEWGFVGGSIFRPPTPGS